MGFRGFWISLRSSFWFIPGLMLVLAIALASFMIYVDRTVDVELAERFPNLFGSNAAGARSILAGIASSMITVAGVTFSITIVALSLASNQYTPRILRNFMRDTGNQLVLGMFVSVFVYCLIVLRSIRGGDNSFVPSYALVAGIFLAITAMGFLIYFIHHIASMVQASTILANIYEETKEVIENLYPDLAEEAPAADDAKFQAGSRHEESVVIVSARTGYVQDLDEHALMAWAEQRNAVIEMTCGIGAFVIQGAPLLTVYGLAAGGESQAKELESRFSISQWRTVDQDPAFGIRQIVDIALKALSPGINDTTTAASCLDYLGALIFELGDRHIPPRERCKDARVRLISCGASYESMVDEALQEIRQHARNNVAVYVKLLETVEKAARSRLAREKTEVLWRHAELVAESAGLEIKAPADRELISQQLARTASKLARDHRPLMLGPLANPGRT